MYQLTTHHNDDLGIDLSDMIEEIEDFGLKVISKTFSTQWDETTLVIEGTKEQFFAWNDAVSDGGPSWNEEEFMEELVEVQAA